ncbi:UDPglucose 6-dehydrogenase [Pseudoduganella lurida]|uniref:UDP-glucose 6-dehydrogenase n=1 Tax=Pseudoduganella lurida TaxID=1036180 RepID=A0A562RN67_9BURK|nr:UDP-glucose/GDP-mannose dehydrogenase family protein [Pseudoduganella lurida]TWI69870.1 UDPglucose 6-dehydrogenase [Pseudoduganella lurida]
MNITIIGAGYVGLVVATCFADVGNEVVCHDLDDDKIARLSRGEVPIHEPNLAPVVTRNRLAGRLRFTTSDALAIGHAGIIFLAVGTPPEGDGSADIDHVLAAARSIGRLMERPLLIVNKSTVPVGTADQVRATVAAALAGRGVDIPFDVVSNPEFLKEGMALQDFMKPDRIIVGAESAHALGVMRQLYAPFSRNHEKFVAMGTRSAELTKYAANAMLATRISFMNELAHLAGQLGADIEAVRLGIGADPRIGRQFLSAGIGYGGSCLPKDVRALIRIAARHGQHLRILRATQEVNDAQQHLLFERLASYFNGASALRGRSIALWGLAFKPDTDDMRDAPSLVLIRALLAAGATVRAYDPVASGQARRLLVAEHGEARCAASVLFASSAQEAVEQADVLVLVTEWQEFRSPDFRYLASTLRAKAVFDGRNIYDRAVLDAAGLYYEGIGRTDDRQGRAAHP